MSDYVSVDKQHPLKHALETSLKNRNVQRRVAYRIIFSALPEVKLMFGRRTTFRDANRRAFVSFVRSFFLSFRF